MRRFLLQWTRLEGAAANLAKRGVNLVPLTTADDYGIQKSVSSEALATLEHEYRAVVTDRGLEAAELFRLGAFADDVLGESSGANRLLAYVLRSVLLDLARRLAGGPVSPELGYFLKTLNAPIEAAIIGLKRPLTEETAAHVAIKLLDGRRSFLA